MSASTTINGGSISYNEASYGGGFYSNKTKVDINGGAITDNKSKNQGGGAYVNFNVITMKDGVIRNNTAKVIFSALSYVKLVTDRADKLETAHVNLAKALYNYCTESVKYYEYINSPDFLPDENESELKPW